MHLSDAKLRRSPQGLAVRLTKRWGEVLPLSEYAGLLVKAWARPWPLEVSSWKTKPLFSEGPRDVSSI